VVSYPRRFLILVLMLVQLAVAACGGGEKRARVEALAGTYVHEEDKQAGEGGQIIHERVALTLRPDYQWTMLRAATVDGEPVISSPSSGTYSLTGDTLVTNSAESGIFRYRVRGDTLWMDGTAAAALTQAVTSIDLGGDGGFLVRER
jgi:hypothetical protein